MKNMTKGNKAIVIATISVMAMFVIKFIVDLIIGNEAGIIGFVLTGWIPMFMGGVLLSTIKNVDDSNKENEG